jgi:hypothetical protein
MCSETALLSINLIVSTGGERMPLIYKPPSAFREIASLANYVVVRRDDDTYRRESACVANERRGAILN